MEQPSEQRSEEPTAVPEPEAATPDASPPGMESLDPRVVVYWLLTGIISLLVLGSFATVALLVFREQLPGDGRAIIIATIVIGSLLTLWALISPSMAYARWRFAIAEELLLARYGIIFHEEKAIPISRLQHVDLTRGPVERLFGLATLVVYTAGTEGASFRLPGLAMERAQRLRDRILVARGDDVI